MLFPYAFILTFTSSSSAHKNVYIDNKNKSIGEFRRWSYRSYYSFDIKEKYYNNLRDIHCLEEVRYSLMFSRFLYQSPIFVVIKKKEKTFVILMLSFLKHFIKVLFQDIFIPILLLTLREDFSKAATIVCVSSNSTF